MTVSKFVENSIGLKRDNLLAAYIKIQKAFSKFYHRHSELIVKYNIGSKSYSAEPIFYGDLVYKFKRIVGKPNFSDQLNFFYQTL